MLTLLIIMFQLWFYFLYYLCCYRLNLIIFLSLSYLLLLFPLCILPFGLFLSPLVSPLFAALTQVLLGSATACLHSVSFFHHVLSSLPRNCLRWSFFSVLSALLSSFCSPLPSHSQFCSILLFILPQLPPFSFHLHYLLFTQTVWSSSIQLLCHNSCHFIKLSRRALANVPHKTSYRTFNIRILWYYLLIVCF